MFYLILKKEALVPVMMFSNQTHYVWDTLIQENIIFDHENGQFFC